MVSKKKEERVSQSSPSVKSIFPDFVNECYYCEGKKMISVFDVVGQEFQVNCPECDGLGYLPVKLYKIDVDGKLKEVKYV